MPIHQPADPTFKMTKRPTRKPTSKSTLAPKPAPGFDRKLLAYALAGGAASVPASAAVVYSGAQNVTVNYGSSAGIDFSGIGAATDFTFNFSNSDYTIRIQSLAASPAASADKVTSFVSGASIGGRLSYSNLNLKPLAEYSGGTTRSGGTFAAGTSFVGVSLPTGNGSDVNYGWIQLTIPANTSSPLTIVDWAHETTVGQAILAGQTSSAVPETGSTALFSLGAAGLCVWRARKRAPRA